MALQNEGKSVLYNFLTPSTMILPYQDMRIYLKHMMLCIALDAYDK